MSKTERKSYAKINIFLYVLNKREDGYHSLYTLFHKIALYDKISITPSKIFSINMLNIKENIPLENNIIYKVHDILKKEYNLKESYLVEVLKNIPTGGGLGGGSSNAHSYLELVNEASHLNLSFQDKLNILSRVGSDTAFFLYDKPMLGSGRGEILTSYPYSIEKFPILLVSSGAPLSTKDVFNIKKIQLTNSEEIDRMELEDISMLNIKKMIHNDLLQPAVRIQPKIMKQLREMYDLKAVASSMSGSGNSLFGIFTGDYDLNNAYEYFKNRYKLDYIKKSRLI